MLDVAPQSYTPDLTRWGRVWRVVLCLVISGFAWGGIAYHQIHEHHLVWFWIDLAGGVVAFGLMRYRRRWPVAIAVVLTLFSLFSMSSAGPSVLAVVSLFTRRNLRHIVPVALLNIVCSQLYSYYDPTNNDPAWVTFTFTVVATIAVVALGMYIGSRRELVWTLRARAADAETGQELRVTQARSAERERIAREMHDVLAHRISLITMHAGALAYRTDLPPEQIRETAQLIQAKSHEALADLRQVLGVLRSPDGVGDRPQPTYGDLDALVAEATAGGMVIDLASDLPDGLQPPDQIGRTVYRVVQEALTNARKHAVGTHVTVRVSGNPTDGLVTEVSNATRVGVLGMPVTPGAGLGLVGLRERAELAGGRLVVTRTPTSFSLRCWLPWTQNTAP